MLLRKWWHQWSACEALCFQGHSYVDVEQLLMLTNNLFWATKLPFHPRHLSLLFCFKFHSLFHFSEGRLVCVSIEGGALELEWEDTREISYLSDGFLFCKFTTFLKIIPSDFYCHNTKFECVHAGCEIEQAIFHLYAKYFIISSQHRFSSPCYTLININTKRMWWRRRKRARKSFSLSDKHEHWNDFWVVEQWLMASHQISLSCWSRVNSLSANLCR